MNAYETFPDIETSPNYYFVLTLQNPKRKFDKQGFIFFIIDKCKEVIFVTLDVLENEGQL